MTSDPLETTMTPYRVFTVECSSLLEILEWQGSLCFRWGAGEHQFCDSAVTCRGLGVCWSQRSPRTRSEPRCGRARRLLSGTRRVKGSADGGALRSPEMRGLYFGSWYCLSECAVPACLTNNKTHGAWKGFGISAMESKRKSWKNGPAGPGK